MKKTLRYLTLCALLPATPIQAGDFKVLQLQYIMPHEYPWVNVITTEADWGNFYYNELLPANGINCHFPTESPFEQNNPCLTGPPDVNFKTSQVIVGGLGLKPSSGFQAMVADVDTTQPTDLVVNIIDGAPSDECILLPVISLEMMTLVVEKSDKPVKVNVQNATLHCETDGALSNY